MDDKNILTRDKPKNPNRVAAGKAVAERKSRGSKEVKAKAQETIRAKPGQPTKFTPELWDQILEAVATYQDLIEICSRDDMPSTVTIYHWMKNDPALKEDMRGAWEMFSMIGHSINKNILRGGVLSSGDVRRDIEMASDNRWHMGKTNRRDFGEKTVVQVENAGPFVLDASMLPFSLSPSHDIIDVKPDEEA
ncbi:hypothetical protein [Sphingomonas paucimobilis]|uniref:terminase small subunit-like protein n=1 Tax=Sphingomonas paucimobilis TaxID=13689 RepID=UPI0031E3900C